MPICQQKFTLKSLHNSPEWFLKSLTFPYKTVDFGNETATKYSFMNIITLILVVARWKRSIKKRTHTHSPREKKKTRNRSKWILIANMYKNPMTIINSWVPHSNNYAYIADISVDMCCSFFPCFVVFLACWPSPSARKFGIKISCTAASTDNTNIQTFAQAQILNFAIQNHHAVLFFSRFFPSFMFFFYFNWTGSGQKKNVHPN